jgi:transposase
MSGPATYSPPEIAERYAVKPSKVLGWIRAGELEAIDVSTRPGVGRPRFRITAAALVAFEERRRVRPPAPRSPRRRKGRTPKSYIT